MATPPVILVSANGNVTHANRAAVELLGEPHGRRCHDYVRARDGSDVSICTVMCAVQLARERDASRDREHARVRRESFRLVCTGMGAQTVVQLLPEPESTGQAALLTPREQEVMGLVAEGCTTAVIARRLTISTATVRTHVEHAREKLGARTRAEAVARLAAVAR